MPRMYMDLLTLCRVVKPPTGTESSTTSACSLSRPVRQVQELPTGRRRLSLKATNVCYARLAYRPNRQIKVIGPMVRAVRVAAEYNGLATHRYAHLSACMVRSRGPL